MTKMRFSVGGSSGLNWQDYVEIAQTCDELGFHGFYPSDHLMQVQQRGTSGARLDSVTVLAALTGHTRRLRLGPLVLANLFRSPVMTAKMFQTIDHASNGRAELGIGASWVEAEHIAHGFPFPPLKERQARLEESLAIITSLWTQERTTFEGQYYSVHDVPFEPKPIQKPYPPIIIGGHSISTLRITARYADEWNMLAPRREVEERIPKMREVCQAAGRDFSALRISTQLPILLSDKKADIESYVERQVSAVAGNPHFKLSPCYTSVEDQIRDGCFAGDAEEIKAQAQRWLDIGVTHIIFTTPRPFDASMMERFARDVAPAFQ